MKNNITIIPVFVLFSLFLSLNLNAQNTAPAEWATCGACHTIGKGKVIGPDLKGISERRDEAWLISFIKSSQTMVKNGDAEAVKIFEEYKIPMPDNNFTDDQVKGILAYIKNYEDTPAAEPKKEEATEAGHDAGHDGEALQTHEVTYGTGNTRTTFLIFLILFFFSMIDLGFTKIIKARFIHYIIILTSLFIIGEIVYVEAAALGRQQGYSPDQPILFSHKVHAGQNQIDCEYCHTGVNDSRHAGIPATNVCMNCHNVVKSGKETGEVEIKKLLDSWENNQPIEWIQVHNVPDHVYFNHAQHVNAGKQECEVCHGAVEEMDRIAQVKDLSMGWCLDCHRTTKVQFEENAYYSSFVKLHEKIKSGEKGVITVEDIGGTDCSACHY